MHTTNSHVCFDFFFSNFSLYEEQSDPLAVGTRRTVSSETRRTGSSASASSRVAEVRRKDSGERAEEGDGEAAGEQVGDGEAAGEQGGEYPGSAGRSSSILKDGGGGDRPSSRGGGGDTSRPGSRRGAGYIPQQTPNNTPKTLDPKVKAN
jgi:hypothetical protein